VDEKPERRTPWTRRPWVWALVGMGAAGAIMASTAVFAAPPPGTVAPSGFWSQLASKLGISQTTLLNDVTAVKDQQLASYAQAHHWSASKLAKAEQRLAKTHWVVEPGRRARPLVLSQLRRIALATAAKTLGLTPKDVRAALKGGSTLAQLATSHGVAPSTLQQDLVMAVDARIATYANNHNLSAAREQQWESRAATAIARLMTHTFNAATPPVSGG
jgi:lambda repressor-like predicted transcriptional regulator